MRNTFIIALREYTDNAKTKGFWIGLTFIPLLLFGSIQVPLWIEKKATPIRHFILMDQSGQFEGTVLAALEKTHQKRVRDALNEYTVRYSKPNTVKEALAKIDLEKIPAPNRRIEGFIESFDPLPADGVPSGASGKDSALLQLKPYLREDAPPFIEPKRNFQRVPTPAEIRTNGELASVATQLRPYLRDEKSIRLDCQTVKLHAAILIPSDVEQKIVRSTQAPGLSQPQGIEYWSGNLADSKLRDILENSINGEIRRREAVARGLDLSSINRVLQTHVPIVDLNPKKEAGQEAVSMADRLRQWAPVAFVYLLWLAIFSIVQMLLNNTIEEKSNRLIEVLLSSVTPGELMMGKLAGISAIGLTLVGAWLVALIGVLVWKAGPEFEFATQALTILRNSHLLPAFLVYFLFGYLLYGGIFLSIGSVCNSLKEAQSYMSVITMAMMLPLLTMMYIPRDPNGTLATVLSWIPIYTPFIMMNRVMADPPMFDLVGTLILMVVSASLVLWLSGKVFRIGILRTGQPPKLLEMVSWLKGEPAVRKNRITSPRN
jgi:ABC-2 type transport system permease protein